MHWLPQPTPAFLNELTVSEQTAVCKLITLADQAGVALTLEPAGTLARNTLRVENSPLSEGVATTHSAHSTNATHAARLTGASSAARVSSVAPLTSIPPAPRIALHYAIEPGDRLMAMMLILLTGQAAPLEAKQIDGLLFCSDAVHGLNTGQTISLADYGPMLDTATVPPMPPKTHVWREVLIRNELLCALVEETTRYRITRFELAPGATLTTARRFLDAAQRATLKEVLTVAPHQHSVYDWSRQLWARITEAGARGMFNPGGPDLDEER